MYQIPEKKHRLKPKTKHKNSDRSKGFKDPAYLSWLHNDKRPCCIVCGRGTIELHHLKKKDQFVRNDNQVVPLCPGCHRTSKLSAHGANSKEFYERYSKELLEIEAKELYDEYINNT